MRRIRPIVILGLIVIVGGSAGVRLVQWMSQAVASATTPISLPMTGNPMPPVNDSSFLTATPIGTSWPGQLIAITSIPGVPLPEDFLPPFTPASPCGLENVTVYVEDLCISQGVAERVVLTGADAVLIEREVRSRSGCVTGIGWEQYYLQTCQLSDGGRAALLESEGPFTLYPSADGRWLAFATSPMSHLRARMLSEPRTSRTGAIIEMLDDQRRSLLRRQLAQG